MVVLCIVCMIGHRIAKFIEGSGGPFIVESDRFHGSLFSCSLLHLLPCLVFTPKEYPKILPTNSSIFKPHLKKFSPNSINKIQRFFCPFPLFSLWRVFKNSINGYRQSVLLSETVQVSWNFQWALFVGIGCFLLP